MLVAGFFIVLILGGCVVGSITYWSLRNGIVPMPSSPKARQAIVEAVPAEFSGVCSELGSAFGTLVHPVSRRCCSAKIIAYETSFVPYWTSRIRFLRRANVFVRRADFFQEDLSDADLIICYLYPNAMRRLEEKLSCELKPGTMIISNTFAISSWIPIKVIELNDLYRTKVYVYRISLPVDNLGQ